MLEILRIIMPVLCGGTVGEMKGGLDIVEEVHCYGPGLTLRVVRSGKTFRGPTQLRSLPAVHRWLVRPPPSSHRAHAARLMCHSVSGATLYADLDC